MKSTQQRYPNIAAELARNNMTKAELAGRLGVSRKTLYNWIVAGGIPQGKLEVMTEVFNCSADYLLGRPCGSASVVAQMK